MAFDPSGTLLATGGGEPSRSGELKLWNVADGKLIRTISPGHSDTVFGLDFSPDGTLLASGAADRIVKVFDVATGGLTNSFEGHTHHVLDVAWRGDGKMLASAGADCVIKFWDYASGDQLRATPTAGKGGHQHRFRRLDEQDDLKLGRSRRPAVQQRYRESQSATSGGATDFLYSVAITPDGKTVVAGGQDSKLLEWNLEGKLLQTLAPPAPPAEKPAGK